MRPARPLSSIVATLLATLAFGLALLPTQIAFAASPLIILSQQLIDGTSPFASGETFKIRLTYECSGSVGTGCDNVVLTTTLPAGIEFVDHSEDGNVQSFSFDPATGKAVWNMVPLSLGSTGQFEIAGRFSRGNTLNGATVAIVSTITSSNATPQNPGPINLTATATDRATISKVLTAAGTVDSQTVYTINVCSSPADGEGALNMTNLSVSDVLPPGAVFVSAVPAPSNVSTVGGVTTLTWAAQPNLNVPDCRPYVVRVTYPDATNDIGDVKVNQASMTYTPFGDSVATTKNTTVSHPIPTGIGKFGGSKDTNLDYAVVGSHIVNTLGVANTGTGDLINVDVIDTLPNHFNVTSIDTTGATAVAYQKNGSATWITGVPLGSNVAVTSFPTFVAGDYVSALRFTVASLKVGDRVGTLLIRSTVVNPANGSATLDPMPLILTNSANGSASYNGSPVPMSNPPSSSVDTDERMPRPTLTKTSSTTQVTPNTDLAYTVALQNRGYTPDTLNEPVIGDLLPNEVTYTDGTWQVLTGAPANCLTPTFSKISNYAGSGRTLLRWDWSGTGCALAAGDPDVGTPGDEVRIQFHVMTAAGLAAGTTVPNSVALLDYSNNPANVKRIDCNATTDKAVFVGGGYDPNKFCTSDQRNVNILTAAQIVSAKWVKGQLDTSFSRDPLVGRTVKSGALTFALELKNTGNVDFNKLQIIDLLPFKDLTANPTSNIGTRDQANLGTAWTPYLAGPIRISPAIPGLQILYSSEENPCRPEVVDSHPDASCTPMTTSAIPGPGVWSTTFPDDPTSVRSLWFKFDPAFTLARGQQMRFEFDMYAPENAPNATAGADGIFGNNDDTNVAWNTFAYRVTRTDDNTDLVAQPPRVGIEVVDDPTLAGFGNYVWNDINNNGLQDEGPDAGINGVTVNLYTSSGTLVGTRTTGFDAAGQPGYYRFGGLTPGDYYAEFVLPDGYSFSPSNVGADDTIDSDGVSTADPLIYRTATETLISGENNLDYDQGLFAAPVSLGDQVWFDTNNNGVIDAGEVGIDGVEVELFRDDDGDGILRGQEQFPIATDTTSNGGFYLFTKQTLLNGATVSDRALYPANYVVGIKASNFGVGKPLFGYLSSGSFIKTDGTVGETAPPSPDLGGSAGNPGVDNDDNGAKVMATPANTTPFYLGGVLSPAVNVNNNEPTGEPAAAGRTNQAPGSVAIADDQSNQTVDFGFYTQELGNFVWHDDGAGANYNNGKKDADETGFSGINVRLYAANGTTEIPVGPDGVFGTADDAIGGITTDASGAYLFRGLPASNGNGYVVKIVAPAGFISSTDTATTGTPNTPNDENVDENGIGAAGGTISSAVNANALLLNPGTNTAPIVANNANGTTTNPTLDFGLVPTYSIGNRVWLDTDNSGTVNGAEVGRDGVTVALYAADASGNPTGPALSTQTTSNGGYYLFTTLLRGDYVVVIPNSNFTGAGALVGYTSSTGSTNDDQIDNNDSGRPGTGTFATSFVSSKIALGPGDSEPTGEGATPGHGDSTPDARSDVTVDFGFYRLTLGNLVWYDVNNDGIYQANGIDGIAGNADDERGISGVRVELYNSSNTLVAVVNTNATGIYTFDRINQGTLSGQGLPAGDYTVRIPASQFASGAALFGFSSSLGSAAAPDPDNNINNDDNGTPVGGNVESLPVTLAAGINGAKPNNTVTNSTAVTADPTVDFGFHTMSLGNLVWNDLNNDGLKGATESGIDGVTVRLYTDNDSNGTPDGAAIATQMTSNGGHYLFTGLTDGGKYIVEIVPPAGYVSSNGQKDNLTAPTPYEPGIAESNAVADDNKDHGTAFSAASIRSGTITLTANNEPAGETDTTNPTGITNTASDTNSQLTIDFGLYTPLSLGNLVWIDTNNNGVKDASETVVPDGVIVNLYWDENGNNAIDGAETTPARTTTTGSGLYLFDTLVPGGYIVELDKANFAAGALLENYVSSTGAPGRLTGPFEGAGAVNPNTVQTDNDDNGNTQPDGSIRTQIITLSAGGEPIGENPDNDPVTPDSSENLTIDFGVFQPASLGDFVWIDSNRNGVQDAGENGIDGVTVTIYDGATALASVVTGDNPATTGTTEQGYYHFPNLEANKTYIVKLDRAADFASGGPLFGYVLTGSNVGSDNTDSDATVVGGIPTISNATTGAATTDTPTYDFGVYPVASLGDYVWLDTNANGVQDAGENGIDGVTVRLYTANGADGIAGNADDTLPVASTTTGDNPATIGTTEQGYYHFANLKPNTVYTVRLDSIIDYASGPLAGLILSVPDQGGNDATDSDASLLGGFATITSAPTGVAGSDTPTYDFGFSQPASLGDYVWRDANADGTQEAGENGIDGVTVRLYTANGADGIAGNADDTLPIATTTTGDNPATAGTTEQGYYHFGNLRPNTTYTVRLDNAADYTAGGPLNGLLLTVQDQPTATDATDSDAAMTGGFAVITSAPTGAPNTDTPTYDFGFFQPASLGDFVWHDTNANGVQDAGENGIDGVTVRLYTANGADGIAGNADDALPIATTTTGDNPATAGTTEQGYYHFGNLRPNTTYTVRLDNAADYTAGGPLNGLLLTAQDQPTATDATDSDAAMSGGFAVITSAPTAGEGTDTPTYDFGFFQPASLGDYVWRDTNANGVQDAGENGIDGVTVRLYTANGADGIAGNADDALPVASTTTGDNPATAGTTEQGYYHFGNLRPNTTYTVRLDNAADYTASGPLNGLLLTVQDQPTATDATDSDAAMSGGFAVITSAPTAGEGTDTPTYDFGFFQPASLGDFVWHDNNANGVQDAGENGIDGVTVRLYTANGADGIAGNADDALPVASTTTGDNPATGGTTEQGYYHFGNLRPNTTYTVRLDNAADYTTGGPLNGLLLTVQDQPTATDATDSDAAMTGGFAVITSAPTAGEGTDTPTYDFGFFQPASLGDYVWRDTNANGTQEAGENGIDGVTVRLFTANGADGIAGNADDALPVASTTTGDNPATAGTTEQGYYHFGNLRPNTTYTVRLDNAADYTTGGPLDGLLLTKQDQGADTTDSDAAMSGGFAVITSAPTAGEGTDTPTYDFGFVAPASLGDYVWIDEDRAGDQNPSEDGLDGVTVNLYAADGTTLLATTITGDNPATAGTTEKGYYHFGGLYPNTNYVIRIDKPADYTSGGPLYGFELTTKDRSGVADTDDSDAGLVTGYPQISAVTGAENSDTPTYDVGFYGTTALGDYVWFDLNNNGIQDAGDTPIDGVTVSLYTANGADGIAGNADDTLPVATAITGDNPLTTGVTEQGYYHFSSLRPNTPYTIKLDNPADYAAGGPLVGLILTDANVGADDTIDSDAALVGGFPTISRTTGTIGSDDPTNDFGFVKSYSLGNRVWFDVNNNSKYDNDEVGAAGVKVQLYLDINANGYDIGDTLIDEQTTNVDGYYLFTQLPAGEYVVVLPEENFTTGTLQGTWSSGTAYNTSGTLAEIAPTDPDDNIDRDDNGEMVGILGQKGGYVVSQAITLGGSAIDDEPINEPDPTDGINDLTPDARSNITLDFGFYTTTLGNRVWHDADNNGLYQPNGADGVAGTADDEAGLGSVAVELWPADSSGNVVGATPLATTTTAADGSYSFAGLPEGDYIVRLAGSNFTTGGALEGYTSSTGALSLSAGSYEPAPSPNNSIDEDDNGSITSSTPGTIDWIANQPLTMTPGDGGFAPGTSVSNPTGKTTNNTVDFGLFKPVSLGNLVFDDINNSGTFDGTDTPLVGVIVKLFDTTGTEIKVGPDGVLGTADDAPGGMLTDSKGNYLFSQLSPGKYIVQVTPPAGYVSSTGKIGSNLSVTGPYEPAPSPDTDIDNDDNGAQSGAIIASSAVTLTSGGEPINDGDTSAESNLTVDFGLFRPAQLGNKVWYDDNKDGTFNPGETGVSGVTVTLYDGAGNPIATTQTDANGNWVFVNLPPDTYSVGFSDLPPSYVFTTPHQGSSSDDSDADPTTGMTQQVVLTPGDSNLTLYAGIVPSVPTPVTLTSFTAREENGQVVVRWVTGAELNNFGFRLYRSTGTRAEATLVTPTMVAAQGTGGAGASYRWVDTTATAGERYSYWLEQVDTSGDATEYGPARLIRAADQSHQLFIPLVTQR